MLLNMRACCIPMLLPNGGKPQNLFLQLKLTLVSTVRWEVLVLFLVLFLWPRFADSKKRDWTSGVLAHWLIIRCIHFGLLQLPCEIRELFEFFSEEMRSKSWPCQACANLSFVNMAAVLASYCRCPCFVCMGAHCSNSCSEKQEEKKQGHEDATSLHLIDFEFWVVGTLCSLGNPRTVSLVIHHFDSECLSQDFSQDLGIPLFSTWLCYGHGLWTSVCMGIFSPSYMAVDHQSFWWPLREQFPSGVEILSLRYLFSSNESNERQTNLCILVINRNDKKSPFGFPGSVKWDTFLGGCLPPVLHVCASRGLTDPNFIRIFLPLCWFNIWQVGGGRVTRFVFLAHTTKCVTRYIILLLTCMRTAKYVTLFFSWLARILHSTLHCSSLDLHAYCKVRYITLLLTCMHTTKYVTLFFSWLARMLQSTWHCSSFDLHAYYKVRYTVLLLTCTRTAKHVTLLSSWLACILQSTLHCSSLDLHAYSKVRYTVLLLTYTHTTKSVALFFSWLALMLHTMWHVSSCHLLTCEGKCQCHGTCMSDVLRFCFLCTGVLTFHNLWTCCLCNPFGLQDVFSYCLALLSFCLV